MKALHILLVIAVLGGRMAVLVHEADVKAHTPGHTCEFCLHVSNLGHATVGLPVNLAVINPARPAFMAVPHLSHQFTFIAFLARAPPRSVPV
ncbi:MAG TPA: hypothetical protein VKA50_08230 [Gammaproteobacteria bacterium]|nr:hypothetical protein [Gammaproteobacteria bacterium]